MTIAKSSMAVLLLTVGLFSLSVQAGSVIQDDLSSEQLSQVVDAAITRLAGRPTWWNDQKITHEFVNALQVFTCTPDDTKWVWPEKSEAYGLLKRVLDSGELKVAGVKWSQGGVADYKTTPTTPTGFWPEYLDEMLNEINTHYQTSIVAKRVYFPDSNLVVDAVAQGTVDMSEPYYYLNGFYNNLPRIEALHASCITAATQGTFITKIDSGIQTLGELYNAINTGDNKDVGFIGAGNAQSVSSILPKNTFFKDSITNGTQLASQVDNSQIIAGYVSEGEPPNPERFFVIPTGIVAPRAVLFRKDLPSCNDTKTKTNAAVLAAVLVLAFATLLLVITISVMIVREKKGRPVFASLLDNDSYEPKGDARM